MTLKVRRKTRNMNYGLSNAVDTIATTLDYNHPNARVLLDSIYGPLVVIGQYGLAIASKTSTYKKSNDEILELFERHNLDGTYLLHTYPPKQIMHTYITARHFTRNSKGTTYGRLVVFTLYVQRRFY